ncbi:MAG TPA: hypothetical protein VFI91_13515 [Longimicrobiaceae bacterium]|nr:hypothetical protein [Longimicrobiaceae bacterium]
MLQRILIGPVCAVLLVGCTGDVPPETAAAEVPAASVTRAPSAAEVCQIINSGTPLPAQIDETSGLAHSRLDDGIFWTHNDSGDNAELFALDADGQMVARVDVSGAEFIDWEDIESGPCDSGSCLYLGDTGDNDEERGFVTIYRIPEPATDAASATATALNARYPAGPRDAEALFVLPSGDIYLVTKGRYDSIDLFHYPMPHQPGETVMLEHIKELAPEPANDADRVTAATATPNGEWVGIRTSNALHLYRTSDLISPQPAQAIVADLSPLGEEQGEAVVIDNDGSVWLTSEAGGNNQLPQWSQLSCTLPGT